jgi:hypothetical protein
MKKIDLTAGQAAKIFWSFIWRGWVLMLPIMILMTIVVRTLIPLPKPGDPPQPPDIKQMPLFFVAWAIMMAIFLASQIFALRWALKAKWSDFRIIAVSPEEESQK